MPRQRQHCVHCVEGQPYICNYCGKASYHPVQEAIATRSTRPPQRNHLEVPLYHIDRDIMDAAAFKVSRKPTTSSCRPHGRCASATASSTTTAASSTTTAASSTTTGASPPDRASSHSAQPKCCSKSPFTHFEWHSRRRCLPLARKFLKRINCWRVERGSKEKNG